MTKTETAVVNAANLGNVEVPTAYIYIGGSLQTSATLDASIEKYLAPYATRLKGQTNGSTRNCSCSVLPYFSGSFACSTFQ